MSDIDSNSSEFDIVEWFSNANISEAGLKKLANAEISDIAVLELMSVDEIHSIKLALADRVRLVHAIKALHAEDVKKPEGPSPSPESIQPAPGSSTTPDQLGSISVAVAKDATEGQASGDQVVQLSVETKKQFSLDEVAGYLAGSQLPADLNAAVREKQLPSQRSTAPVALPGVSQQPLLGQPSVLPSQS